ncbi:MAG: glycosyltransferase [Bacteroidetes bacterium]|nr:glycosyltransferase [Bacteroidota bacterium]
MKQLSVIATAYACEPETGSETGIGWNIVREVGRRVEDLVVITRENNRDAIDRALEQDPEPGLRFVYYDLPKWARWWKRGHRGVQAYYYLWQIGAARLAHELHRGANFDLAHHVTFGRYWSPTFLTRLGIPLVWGPIGGGESAPPGFWADFPPRDKLFEMARSAARSLGQLDPFVRRAARNCRMALPTTAETDAKLRDLNVASTRILGNAALASKDFASLGAIPAVPPAPIRFVSIGRMLNWKGFSMSMRAFARMDRRGSEYWLVGDGPDRNRLERLAEELGIADAVKFTGNISRDETFAVLGKSHVLLHPSLHDSGGWVCIEAMAAGRPVICFDLGGPALMVDSHSGFKLSAGDTETGIRRLQEAMQSAVDDPQTVSTLGAGAQERARELFSWERKADEIVDAYEEVLGRVTTTAETH